MTEVEIGYRKNDFLWNLNNDCVENKSDCSGNIALNKEKSIELIEKQHIHNGSDERYNNIHAQFNRKYMDAFNLLLGMLLCVIYIIYNYEAKMMYVLMIGICFILILFSYDYASAPIVLLVIIIAILFKYYIAQG